MAGHRRAIGRNIGGGVDHAGANGYDLRRTDRHLWASGKILAAIYFLREGMSMNEPRKITLPCHVVFNAETGEILSASCDVAEIMRALGQSSEVDIAGLAAAVDVDTNGAA